MIRVLSAPIASASTACPRSGWSPNRDSTTYAHMVTPCARSTGASMSRSDWLNGATIAARSGRSSTNEDDTV
jgi:hypothetical protein